MKALLLSTLLLMLTLTASASESFFDIGSDPNTVKDGGFEVGIDLPLGTNYTENYDPALHLRFFPLEDVSLGLYGRWSEGKITNRYSIGPSIRAYFLTLGPVNFTISQTFALAISRAKNENDEKLYNDSSFQSIARIGLQVNLGKGLALGYELNNHSVIEDNSNTGSYYESRVNLFYHHNKKEVQKSTGVPYPEKLSDKRKLSSQYLFGSRSVGHLVTSNASTLNKGEISFGTLYTGYAISDSWNIVTSPFAYLAYDMATLISRHGFDISPTERFGLEASHYKSINPKNEIRYYDGQFRNASTKTGYDTFKMEASSLKLTYSKLLTPNYRFNLTASYFYYFDDDRPFSLRMDPQNSDPFAVSITSLHEFRLANNFFISAELGSWGLNYHHPYYHAGLSINMQRKHIYLGLGASSTFNFNIPDNKLKRYAGYDSHWSIHPELQAQLFF